MRKIVDIAAYIFLIAIGLFAALGIMGIWEVVSESVLEKSFSSGGLLLLVFLIMLLAEKFIDKDDAQEAMVPYDVSGFTSLRHAISGLLFGSVGVLLILGLLAIWEVLEGSALEDVFATLGVIIFTSIVAVIVCLIREGKNVFGSQGGGHQSHLKGFIIFVGFLVFLAFMVQLIF